MYYPSIFLYFLFAANRNAGKFIAAYTSAAPIFIRYGYKLPFAVALAISMPHIPNAAAIRSPVINIYVMFISSVSPFALGFRLGFARLRTFGIFL